MLNRIRSLIAPVIVVVLVALSRVTKFFGRFFSLNVDSVVADFTKLEAKLAKVEERHVSRLADMQTQRTRLLLKMIAGETELARASRVRGRVQKLLD